MEKVWYIKIDGKKLGPFSIADLREDPKVTPDTLVWKKGFADWVPIRNVKELKAVFKDEKAEKQPPQETEEKKELSLEGDVLAIDYAPPHFVGWLIVVILILLYAIYSLYYK